MVIINNMPTYNKAIITQVRRQSASQLQLMPSLCADRIQLQLCSYIARIPIVPVGWGVGGWGYNLFHATQAGGGPEQGCSQSYSSEIF